MMMAMIRRMLQHEPLNERKPRISHDGLGVI